MPAVGMYVLDQINWRFISFSINLRTKKKRFKIFFSVLPFGLKNQDGINYF